MGFEKSDALPMSSRQASSISKRTAPVRCLKYLENRWPMDFTDLNLAVTLLASTLELIESRTSLDWRGRAHQTLQLV